MAFRLEIGQYWPARSPIHALDPRVKLPCALALMVAAFMVGTPLQLAAALAVALATLVASRVPPRAVLASVRPVLALMLVLSVFNLFFVTTGPVAFSAGPVTITWDGVWAAVLYTLRFAAALVLGSLIMLTTTPTALTDACDVLLSPLARVGVPAHELAMVLSLMLRFVPTLSDECSAIMDAQTARGATLSHGSLVQRARAMVSVVVALLASSVRHATDLSRALDARCYEGGAERTRLHPLRLAPHDGVAVVVTLAVLAGLACLGALG